jgi:hypothetical protein
MPYIVKTLILSISILFVHFISAILQIAQDIFENSAVASSADDEDVWGTIFRLVTNEVPSILQNFTQSRVSELQLRVVLLSAVLCHAVSCTNRRTYIERIMELIPTVQQQLMAVIEKHKMNATPSKQISQKKMTPKSSNHTHQSHSFDASSSPNRVMSVGKSIHSLTSPGRSRGTPEQRADMERQQDLDALLSWLATFPEMKQISKEELRNLESENISR